ncbi:MAG: HAD-IIB family hydrolase [bacterium]
MNIIISDIDGTLLGDRVGLADFNQYIEGIRDKVFLVYATGRSYGEYLNALKEEGLILPNAVITSTGADIYLKNKDTYEMDKKWHEIIGSNAWNVDLVRNLLDKLPELISQTAKNDYKASYYLNNKHLKTLEIKVIELIKSIGIKAKVISSHGIYLDILPENCDKGEAAVYLVKKLKMSHSDVIVAGDSENDVDLFRKFKHGIIVGNAHLAMKELLKGNDYYEATAHAAAGLLEGLRYYAGKNIFKI